MIENKKGVSAVVGTMLMVALTIAVVSMVWVIVDNIVNENIENSEACFNVFDKVSLEPLYTCYNNTATTDELWFSINVGDIETIDDILVSITEGGNSVSFKIIEDNPQLLRYYNRTIPAVMTIPGKNSGVTYIYSLPPTFTQEPDKLEIALLIDGETCGDLGTIEEFDSCSLLS